MGGFFGVVSKDDCVGDLFYGIDYHSHLGTKRGGMALCDHKGRIIKRIHDITNSPFRSKFDEDLDELYGKSGIGIISDYEDQPLTIYSHLGNYAIVTVGRINNINELIKLSLSNNLAHFSEMSGGKINPTEVVASLINVKDSISKGIEYAHKLIDGSMSILILKDNSIYAARDKYGRTPVIIGKKDGAYAITMETSAFPNLDYEVEYELGPGEIIQVTADELIQKKAPGDKMKICAFLWVYYGYPSSCYEGVNAEGTRNRNGALMAEEDDVEIDSVCGIPDSGIAHAVGYSNAKKKPYERSFVKYTPTWARSFMPQNQKIRDLMAKMKLIPIKEKIEGKRLLFCDDSIVRGTQLKDTANRLYGLGAKEVHMRSACPPLVYGCKFLNFSTSRSELDLAARRAIEKLCGKELDDETLAKYTEYGSPEYNAMVEEIRKQLNLTTLKFQKLPKLLEAIGIDPDKVCTYCWNGKDVE